MKRKFDSNAGFVRSEIPMGTCRVIKVRASIVERAEKRNENARFSGMGCVQEAALRLLHASRGTPRSRTLPIPGAPSNGETTGSYRRSLSCQPKGQPHYATYGAPESRAHFLSENRAEGSIENLNNLDRNSHASQDVSAAPHLRSDSAINK